MNEFALGVFVGIASWKVLTMPISITAAILEYEVTMSYGGVLLEMGITLLFMLLALLVYTEVIL